MKAYRRRFGVKIGTGNFYRDLQRLVAEGLVRTAERVSSDDPRRAPYEITDSGRALFSRWFVSVSSVTATGHEDQLSARLAFIADVAPDDARRVLDYFQDDLWSHAKSLERMRESTLADAERDRDDAFPVLALMLDRRIRRVAAELAFLDDVRATHEEWLTRRSRISRPAADTPVASDGVRLKRSPPRTRSR
jgi:DNA-binding PadR family transcriptional regulator